MPWIRRAIVLATSVAVLVGLLVSPVTAAPAPPAAVPAPRAAEAAVATVTAPPPALSGVPSRSGPTSRVLHEVRALAAATDGTCPPSLPVGASVRIGGPARTVFTGSASCARSTWRMTVTGGSGTIGTMALPSAAFRGSIARSRWSTSGRVIVRLASAPRVVPSWSASSYVEVRPILDGWTSVVRLVQSAGPSASLSLSGPLGTDGSYRLVGRGRVAFAGTRVPFSGSYRSAGYPYSAPDGSLRRTAAATWRFDGRGADGAITGARIESPALHLTQRRPGATGTAVLRTTGAPGLVARGSLDVVSSATWSLSVHGASAPTTWSPAGTSGLSVSTASVAGSVGVRAGLARWALTSPSTLVDGDIRARAAFSWEGPARFRLRATGGSGRILGRPELLAFDGGRESVLMSGGRISGSVSLVNEGELLADLEDHWSSSTTFLLTPVRSGSGWSVRHAVRYDMVNGSSRLRFAGTVPRSNVFALVGSGALRIEGTDVPFHGSYLSAGNVQRDHVLVDPVWSLWGSPAAAPGGRVRLQGGASLTGGVLGFDGGHGAPSATAPQGAASPAKLAAVEPAGVTVTPSGVAGEAFVQFDDGDSFLLPVTYTYTDENDWTVTAAGTTPGNLYNPYTGLAIPETAFHGSATDVHGTQTWDVAVDAVVWSDMAKGITLTGAFSVSNTCPLTAHCPGGSAIFFGSTSTLTFDSDLPAVEVTGAFTSDKSWARWDGISDDVTFNGIGITSPDLTVWKGARDDESPDLTMPDLSSYNGNGLGVEFCGDYRVAIPDIATLTTFGCVEWTKVGVVMAQTATGGAVSPGSYNGITLNSVGLTGYAWSGLTAKQTITLNGSTFDLATGRNYITADLGIPGKVMHDVGAGTSDDTTISATGWFDQTQFELDGDIEVNLKSSGFTLKDITVHVEKTNEEFTLSMGADATVALNGHHYPFDVYVGYEKDTDTTITVRLDATGYASSHPDGLMDFATLLPGGDFEPVNGALVDGTFDSKQPPSSVTDGGFENAKAEDNLIANGAFENGTGQNLMPNPGFEDASTGNILSNGDAEDSDVLYNGDFEADAGTVMPGWTTSTGFTSALISDTAPATESGTYATTVTNNATSGTTSNAGLTQTISWAPPSGTALTLSGWVRGSGTSSTAFSAVLRQTGCASGTYTTTSDSVSAAPSSWSQITVSATAQSSCTGLVVVLQPTVAGGSVAVDAWSLVVGTPTSATTLPTVYRPHDVARFDSLASTPLASHSFGVSQSSDYGGTLASDGCSGWMLSSSSYGYASGDFDMSVKVLFPSGAAAGSREIADVGFWMNAGSPYNQGYYFRLQTSGGDGGFEYFNSSGAFYVPGMQKFADVATDVWYQVRLTAVNGVVTAWVVRLDTNATVFTQTLDMGGLLPHSGVFGQFADGACTAQGIRFDDLSVYGANLGAQVRLDPANAHSGAGYEALKGVVPGWSSQYSTGEAPGQGSMYTYSAWVRSASGTVSGNLVLEAVGGTTESAQEAFTASSSWQQVAVTLMVNDAGHTDLRPGFLGMSTTGIELQVDDQVLQRVYWLPTAGTVLEQTTSDAHSGDASLQLTDLASGSTFLTEIGEQPPAAQATYTLTAWVKAPAGAVAGSVLLADDVFGGGTRVSFNATTGWTQISVARTVGTSAAPLALYLTINSGYTGLPLEIDDLSLTVTGITSYPSNTLGAPPVPAGWSNTGQKVFAVNSPSLCHSGNGCMKIVPISGTAQSTSYVAPATLLVGQTYIVNIALKSGNPSGVSTTVNISDGVGDANGKTFSITNASWAELAPRITITKAGATALTLKITDNDTLGHEVHVDDISVSLLGLAPQDPWAGSDSTGFTSYEVTADGSVAHTGTNYLSATESGGSSSGAVRVDSAQRPAPGDTLELGFWAKAPSGTPTVGGRLSTQNAGGTMLDSRQASFVLGPTWQHFAVSLQVVTAGAANVRTELLVSPGTTVYFDDVESRGIATWDPVSTSSGTSVDEQVISDATPGPAQGSSYLALTVPTSGGTTTTIAQDESGEPVDVVAGSSYRLEAYVRGNADTTWTNGVSLSLGFDGATTDATSQTFDVTGAWTKVSITAVASTNHTSIVPRVVFVSSGRWYVDSITVTPVLIEQADPWTATDASVTFGDYDDPSRAHDSSYGVLEMSRTGGTSSSGVQHSMTQTTSVGQVYNATAWVRSSTGTPVAGTVVLTTVGGTVETVSAPFTATSDWQPVSLRMVVAQTGHTGLTAKVLLGTAGVVLDVDDVVVQLNPWTATSDAGGSVAQTVIADGTSAQSGSGYLELTNTGSAGGDTYLDTAGTYPLASIWTAKVYVRSHTGDPVNGVLKLGPTGGAAASQSFTAGATWTPVTVSYTVSGTAPSSLRTDVRIDTSGAGVDWSTEGLDLDSATLDDGTPQPDGVTTPLPHPESGWVYLWDDAFGIPGAHLWALTAQVQFVEGHPGLGIGGTMYHDPTRSPRLMSGTDWIKGDMALNVSKEEPCFSFDFASTGNSEIFIDNGVFTAKDFSVNVAPRGCEIGAYVLPRGSSLSFDVGIGSGTVHLDLSITEQKDGPHFYEQLGITDLNIGGTEFKNMLLTVDVAPTSTTDSFVGDFVMPPGVFNGDFDLSMGDNGMKMDGAVQLSDWKYAGGGFDVQEFDFQMSMDMPVGDGCSSITADANGTMTMAKRTGLIFEGAIETDCGKLKVLHLDYDYYHGGKSEKFNLDYDSTSNHLAGGVDFKFERRSSWLFFGHRYTRHPKFEIDLSYSMDTNNPAATLDASLYGSLSVADGDGSISCTINGGSQDDSCKLHVHIGVGGGHTFDDSW